MNRTQKNNEQDKIQPWYNVSAEEALKQLDSLADGLSSPEAAKRLATDGLNELKEVKKNNALHIFFSQFKSLIIWILIVAGIVSGLLGETIDAIAILSIVILNAIIGFYQEYSAEKSIEALKKMTAPHAKVKRDGQVVSIPATDIVVGDILFLEAGDLVPADARLLSAASFKCVESALTGESESVIKQPATLDQNNIPLADRENIIFMGTSVATGTAQAIVFATAMNTELGRIAGLIEEAGDEERTPLEKKLESFGHILIWATLGIVIVLFGLGWLREKEMLELFMTSVSLAVAAIPEGLPAVVTVALGLGVLRMSRRNALVRKLPAVETLGSTTVICTDKTGTLTVGEMTVRALYVSGKIYSVTGEGYGPEGKILFDGNETESIHAKPLLELATNLIGCNNANLKNEDGVWKVIGDPTEGAMLSAGIKAGGNQEHINKEMPKQYEFPFDSDRKRSTVVRKMNDGKYRAFTNGAPGILLQLCTRLYTSEGVRELTDQDRVNILAETTTMAKQALRVLGSAYRNLENSSVKDLEVNEVEKDLIFIGLSGMYDPPRSEAKDAIKECNDAGIRVVMITGDHPDTAAAIAQEIGITSKVDKAVSGVELEKMSDQDLNKAVSNISVYARVTAEHKLRIIRAWKENDAVVAMTGDGVNDAPAIKGADIGIAMGRTGTEVTKQASDMIITDDNFATIVAAVEEGRGIYYNIRKTLQYLLAGNTGELLLMTISVIIGLPAPLLPIHLLWINLVTDGLPALTLATDKIDSDVMKRTPRKRSERITDGSFFQTMFFTGFLTAGVAFAVYLYMLQNQTTETARTYAFTVLVFAELLRSFGARSETKYVWQISLFTNINLVIVVAISFGLQILSQHNNVLGAFLKTTYMPFSDVVILIALGTIPLLALEVTKVVKKHYRSKQKI